MLPDWVSNQVAEFLAAIAACDDPDTALSIGLERAVEALEAEIGAAVEGGQVVLAIGFPPARVPEDELVHAAAFRQATLDAAGVGDCDTLAVDYDETGGARMLIARRDDPFSHAEANLLRTLGRVLSLTLRAIRARVQDRMLREAIEERSRLLERLSRIVRSISHRTTLQTVLDAITDGAAELMGEDLVGLRLLDPDDPASVVLVSHKGIRDDAVALLRRTALGEGAGGRAVAEGRLVVIEHYDDSAAGLNYFRQDSLKSAMAAPVHEGGRVVGSLTVGSYRAGRRYSQEEREALLAFAEHASLALTDARIHESMIEAQRSKDLFLAMVSHELKTPLTVMMGTLRTIESRHDVLPADLRNQLLATAFERGRQLERLIDSLLQGARAELASILEKTTLHDVVEDALRGFEYSRRLQRGEVPDIGMITDVAAVRGVLGTLLENAVSHSPEGSAIIVEAAVHEHQAVVTIRNEGSLPPQVAGEALFAPFQRGPDAESSGVGLGLYIANRLATSLGGVIEADACAGVVSFTFRFPYEADVAVSRNSRTAVS